ncbi:MAG: DNA helicase RecQ [Acidobacteriota bacterium]
MKTPQSILKETFGFDSFRPNQLEVIESILGRRDTLAVMPTGGGKSLCYQIPALLFEGITLVVSPLIALMKDQVEQLRAYGVPAAVLNSSISREEYQASLRDIRNGAARVLYLAPETLFMPRTLDLLANLKVDLLTIDEAHCISEWGHDFRPEYRRLTEVRELLKDVVCLAMTATATPRVRQDIRSSLRLTSANEIVASFNRENLFLTVWPKIDALRQTETFLKKFKDQSGIIYCFSRAQVDELSEYLEDHGYSVRPYHAGLDGKERQQNQEAFIRDDVQIMVATIAFGMGINKPNVRFVMHFDLPKSIEGYYQEIGRAGRDGLPSDCLLLYTYADASKLQYFISQKEEPERQVSEMHLQSIVRFAEDDVNCRRRPLLAYFGETFSARRCGTCDNCTSAPIQTADITIPAQKFLSCVKRTGERFGAGHVADVLLGNDGEKISKLHHNTLSTFGIGKELGRNEWMGLARQLVKLDLLDQDPTYRTLRLTSKAMETLRNREIIMGAALQFKERKRIRPDKTRALEPDYDHVLFDLLRGKRKELADEAGVPPYVVFSDRTLVEMAAYRPLKERSLLRINGVGEVKAERYGSIFLTVIQDYCRQHALEENFRGPATQTNSSRPVSRPVSPRDGKSRSLFVGQAYNAGASAQLVMSQFQIKARTLIDHLLKFIADGNTLRRDDDLRSLVTAGLEDQEKVLKAFEELGTERLRPVFDKLEERVSYDDLNILRVVHRAGGSAGESR